MFFTKLGIAFSGFPAPKAFGVETSGDVISVIIEGAATVSSFISGADLPGSYISASHTR